LNDLNKLKRVMATDIHTFSKKYYELGKGKIACLNDLRSLIESL
jgi:hypothetical protein